MDVAAGSSQPPVGDDGETAEYAVAIDGESLIHECNATVVLTVASSPGREFHP